MPTIVLFDGVCHMCNGVVRFTIKKDPKKHFLFVPLQSKKGRVLLRKYKLPKDTSTIILIEEDKIYTKSTAFLRIMKKLNGTWPALFGFTIIPRFLRDAVYDVIAKNRYKWFGKMKTCPVPPPEWKGRFLS